MSGLRWLAGGAAAVVVAPLSVVLLLSPPTGEASCGGDGPIVDVPAHQFSQQEMTDLWVASGGSRASTRVSGVGDVPDPVIAGAVGMAESGGDPGVVNRIGAGGLMQVHPPEPNYLDPGTNMHIAVGKWREAKARGGTGWEPWEAFTGPDARGDDGPFRRRLPDVLGGATGGAGTIAPADCGGDIGGGSELGPVSGDWLASVPGMPGEQCDRRIVPDVEALIRRYHGASRTATRRRGTPLAVSIRSGSAPTSCPVTAARGMT